MSQILNLRNLTETYNKPRENIYGCIKELPQQPLKTVFSLSLIVHIYKQPIYDKRKQT